MPVSYVGNSVSESVLFAFSFSESEGDHLRCLRAVCVLSCELSVSFAFFLTYVGTPFINFLIDV